MKSMKILLVTILLLLIWAIPSGAIQYTFTKIADTSGPFSGFFEPSINAGGTVAFRANLDAGGQGIFTGSGGPVTTIADTSGPFLLFDPLPSINAAGTVTFVAALPGGGQGIFTGSGGGDHNPLRHGRRI